LRVRKAKGGARIRDHISFFITMLIHKGYGRIWAIRQM
jgi:hypothetical protein